MFVVGSPLIESGELLGAVVLVDDISEQLRLDNVRRDFVANVSHELRTPVGAVRLLAETLESESDPEVIDTFLGRIQNESDRLAKLIDTLLDLSRIEGAVDAEVVELDVAAIVRESAGSLAAAADKKEIELDIDIEDTPMIMGIPNQLFSAVTNLFANSIKYTNEGGRVQGRVVSHGDEVAIAVEDTGIGIPAKDLDRVFERFYRVCLLYTSPSPRDQRGSRMPSSA